MTFFWIHFAFSLFWIFGTWAQWWVDISLQIYLIIVSSLTFSNATVHDDISDYQDRIITMILGTHLFTLVTSVTMT
jgi:hypothetical protein